MTNLKAAFPDLEVSIDKIVTEGNMKAWRRTITGTHTKPLQGELPSGQKITWEEYIFTAYDDQGKISEEWGRGNLVEQIRAARTGDGIYTYLSPMKGLGIIQNGYFSWTLGMESDNEQPLSEYGTYTYDNGTYHFTIEYSSDAGNAGSQFSSRPISWSGDTLTFHNFDQAGEKIGEGRAVRVSR